MSDPTKDTTFALSSTISAHGDDVNSLVLRTPTGKDVRELGFPYKMMSDGLVILSGVTAVYISRLASIPMSSVDQLSAPDMNDLGTVIAGFFQNSETTPKS